MPRELGPIVRRCTNELVATEEKNETPREKKREKKEWPEQTLTDSRPRRSSKTRATTLQWDLLRSSITDRYKWTAINIPACVPKETIRC